MSGLEGARALKPAHALLQACMHRAGNPDHDPDRLIWLYDIHLLVSAMSESEMQEFADRAVHENLQDICTSALETVRSRFNTEISPQVLQTLATPADPGVSPGQKLMDSQLGLIIDDLKELPDLKSRLALTREYLAPPGSYLLQRYGKEGWYWVPLLYCRYMTSGLIDRVTLR